jgi:uridylate kinase
MPLTKPIIVKVSGEGLASSSEPYDLGIIDNLALDFRSAIRADIAVGLVIGGGNFVRGRTAHTHGITQAVGDQMGMLATVINGIALVDLFRKRDVPSTAFSAIPMPFTVTPYTRDAVRQAWSRGEVAILCGGTGVTCFTTDTAAAQRAAELEAGTILKATNVDGVYSADPKTNPSATRFETLTYDDALQKDLRVMDATAFALAREYKIPIVVYRLGENDAISRIARGEAVGTRIA